MIKIAIFGHSPDAFSNVDAVKNDIENAIAIVKRQHRQEHDLRFLLTCEPGVSQWFGDFLREQELSYEVYLSSPPFETSKYWSEQQQEHFIWQLSGSTAVHVFGVDNTPEFRIKRDKKVVDDSQWVLVFWNGKHQGYTYHAMEYALKNNKIVFNGLEGLRLVDGEALKTKSGLE